MARRTGSRRHIPMFGTPTANADRKRLEALTRTRAAARRFSRRQDHVYGYQLGLFIELDTDKAAYLVEVYQEGAKVSEVTPNRRALRRRDERSDCR